MYSVPGRILLFVTLLTCQVGGGGVRGHLVQEAAQSSPHRLDLDHLGPVGGLQMPHGLEDEEEQLLGVTIGLIVKEN